MYKRIVSFDVGDVWIGVAHSDLLQSIAIPQSTWRNKDFDSEFRKYLKLNTVECALIGLPKTLNGKESEQTEKVYQWVNKKKHIFEENNILIYFCDERLSSQFAKKIMQQNKNNKHSDHSIAASIILENFLLQKKN